MKNFTFKSKYMLWSLIPIFIFIVSELILTKIGAVGHVFSVPKITEIHKANEVSKQLFMVVSTLVFFIGATLVTIYAFADLRRRFKPPQMWPFILGFLFAIIAFLYKQPDIIFPTISNSDHPLMHYHEIFGLVADCSQVTFYEKALNSLNGGLFDNFKLIYQIGGALLAFGLWAVISGSISCLATPVVNESTYDPSSELVRLDHYLFLAAILLVTGIIYVVSWLSLPEVLFPVEANCKNDSTCILQIKAFKNIVNSMAIYAGITFSMVIASYYIPIRYMVLAKMPKEDLEKRNVIEVDDEADEGGKFSSIIRVVARTKAQKEFYAATLKIASPIIAAWLTTYLSAVTS